MPTIEWSNRQAPESKLRFAPFLLRTLEVEIGVFGVREFRLLATQHETYERVKATNVLGAFWIDGSSSSACIVLTKRPSRLGCFDL